MMSLWVLVVGSAALAQSGPELHAEYGFERGVAEHTGGTDLTGVRVQAGTVGFSTPTPPIRLIADRWMAIQTVAFDHQWVRYVGAPDAGWPEGRLDLFRLCVGTLHVWTPRDRLNIVALVEPGLFSDFRGRVRLDHFSVSVVGLASWSFSDSVSAGAGFGWLTSVGRPRLLPLVSTRIERETLTIDLLLPRTLTVDAKVKGPLSMGIAGEFTGGLFRLHQEDQGLPARAYQEVQTLSVGPTVSATLRDRVRLTGAAGWQPLLRLSILEGRDTELAAIRMRPGWSVSAQIGVTPRKPSREVPSEAEPPASPEGSPTQAQPADDPPS